MFLIYGVANSYSVDMGLNGYQQLITLDGNGFFGFLSLIVSYFIFIVFYIDFYKTLKRGDENYVLLVKAIFSYGALILSCFMSIKSLMMLDILVRIPIMFLLFIHIIINIYLSKKIKSVYMLYSIIFLIQLLGVFMITYEIIEMSTT